MSKERGKSKSESQREESSERTDESVERVETLEEIVARVQGETEAAVTEAEQETHLEDPMEWVRLAGMQAESAVVAAESSPQAGEAPVAAALTPSVRETYDLDPAAYDLPKASGPSA
jgi:hypothetical protein